MIKKVHVAILHLKLCFHCIMIVRQRKILNLHDKKIKEIEVSFKRLSI